MKKTIVALIIVKTEGKPTLIYASKINIYIRLKCCYTMLALRFLKLCCILIVLLHTEHVQYVQYVISTKADINDDLSYQS